MSVYSGTLTSRSVHPASPVLLTKNGPLKALHSCPPLIKKGRLLTYLKFENTLRLFRPETSNHSLYLIKLFVTSFCYPEGNFGRNQLLDGSISLSPLYSDSTIDLHVRTATSLHQSFLWLHPIQV